MHTGATEEGVSSGTAAPGHASHSEGPEGDSCDRSTGEGANASAEDANASASAGAKPSSAVVSVVEEWRALAVVLKGMGWSEKVCERGIKRMH